MADDGDICEVCDNTGRLLNDVCPLCDGAARDEEALSVSTSTSASEDGEDSDENCISDYDEDELTLLPPAVSRWSPGARVDYDGNGNNTFNFARVTAVNPDGTYNVVGNEGLHHTGIAGSQLRSPVRKAKAVPLLDKMKVNFPPPGLELPCNASASATSTPDTSGSGDDSDASDWSPVFQAPVPSFHWELEHIDTEEIGEASDSPIKPLSPDAQAGLRGLGARFAPCQEDGSPTLGGPILDLLKSLGLGTAVKQAASGGYVGVSAVAVRDASTVLH